VLGALTLALAYLLGSIPFSYVVARLWGVPDVRQVGSGNVGATNVMRTAGKAAGITALMLDFAKGAGAVLLALRWGEGSALPGLAAVFAAVGHMYPVWLGFKGGKGVSTSAGAFLPLAPAATATALVAFIVAAAGTRYVSIGSIAGAVTLAVTAFVFEAPASVSRAAVVACLLVIWKHRGNLGRIAHGTERRLGGPRPGTPTE